MPDLSNIKRPNTFLGNLKTKEELIRDEITKSNPTLDTWTSSEEVISRAAFGNPNVKSYQAGAFANLDVPEEIPYETESEEDETQS